MVVDYQNSKIYKIINDALPELVYYGSTTNTLTKRFCQHNVKSNKCSSNQLFDCDVKPQIFLVESFPCNSKDELNARERWYVENNDCVNKRIPNRTQKEYQLDNKEKIKKSQKEWYEDNKERLKLKSKEYQLKLREKRLKLKLEKSNLIL